MQKQLLKQEKASIMEGIFIKRTLAQNGGFYAPQEYDVNH